MRSSNIGLVMLNDEREHVYRTNNELNMNIVNQWADLIRKNVKNIDGSSPNVIVGSKIITSVRVAQEMGEELTRANVKIVILCYNVWNFPFLVWPFLQTIGIDKPILQLSNNNGEFPGNVGLLATSGALRQVGIQDHRIVGDIGDKKTQENVFTWIKSAEACATMKNEVFGIYGGHSMGMETGYFHLTPTIKMLGLTGRQVDQLWLLEKMKEVDENEVKRGLKWFEELLGDRLKYDGKMLTPESLETQIRLYIAMNMVNKEKGFDFCGLKGQRELTEYVTLGDVPEMLMNDPYDWNGRKETMVCSTEADAYAAITMQILKYISGGLPALFMDVRLYHPDLDLWDFCNSGNHSSYYAKRSFDPKENFSVISFHPALELYFKAGGASVEFDAAPGKMTFCRLGLWNNDKLYMVIVKGESLDLPKEKRKKLAEETNPTWPHVWTRLNCNFEEFLSTFPCNHILAVHGDFLQHLVYYCEIANIIPVILGNDKDSRTLPIWERL